MHHRRLDFQVAARIEEAAQGRDQSCAGEEYLPRLVVDDEIEMALPVAAFLVREPVVLVGQWPQGLGEQLDFRGLNGEFAGIGLHQGTAHARDVAEIPKVPEVGVGIVAHLVPADVALDASARILKR